MPKLKKETISEKIVKKLEIEQLPEGIESPKKTLSQIATKLNKKSQSAQIAKNKEGVERIPTGVLALDYLLRGGIPRGRETFIVGREASWKSTLCLRTIASMQKLGGTAAYVDGERGFDGEWAVAHGVDLDRLLLIEPETAEQAYNHMTTCILDGIDIVILDSLNSLAVKKEMFQDEQGLDPALIEKEVMGLAAKKTSQWIRTNTGRISKAKTTFMVIGQLRDNLSMFGATEKTTGGWAIKYGSSVTLLSRQLTGKENQIRDENDDVVGKKYEIAVDKNRLGRDKTVCQFTAYGALVDNYQTMLAIGQKEGFILKPNSKTFIWREKSFNGKNAIIDALYNNVDDMYTKCEKELQGIMGSRIYQYNPFQKQQDIEAAQSVVIGDVEEIAEEVDDISTNFSE